MKKNACIFALISGALILFVAAGCGQKSGIYGKALTETKVSAVSELFKNPDSFSGKTARIEGKIVQECPSGGWFMLKDDSGVILVDLHPSYLAIPQAVGRRVAAQGRVKKESGQVSVVGEGVELK